MENMGPQYNAPLPNPMPMPAAQQPAHMMMPNMEPHVSVYNLNYVKPYPAPAPVYTAPAAHHPVRPFMTTTGVILVLFILLVIVSRAPYGFAGKC